MKKNITIIIFILLLITSCSKKNITIKLNIEEELSHFMTYSSEYQINQNDTFEFPKLNQNAYATNTLIENDEFSTYTRTIYTISFTGWKDENNNIVTTNSITLDQNKTFSPVYNISTSTHVIEFQTEGFKLTFENTDDIYKLILPKIEDKNYVFSGWYYDKTCYGNQIQELTFTQENSTKKLYTKITPTVEYTNSLINDISDELNIFEIQKIEKAYICYNSLSYKDKKLVENYDKLISSYNELSNLVEAYGLYEELNIIYKHEITADLKEIIDAFLEKIINTEQSIINLIPNLDFEKIENINNEVTKLYETYIEEAKTFDKKIAEIPIYLEQYYESEIISLYNEYQNLGNNTKSLLKTALKLETLYKNLQNLQNEKIIYYLNTPNTNNVYLSKQQLFEAFFTDFYYYIAAYHGLNHLNQNNIYNVADFLNLAQDFYGAGVSNLYGIGNLACTYLLEKDINGILENQTDNAFFGFLYQNNLYQDVLPFFINFFAYWRIDEKYANQSNYGADIFAESWAPTVDIAKFFYYNEETSYVQTDRMIDCLTNTASVIYNFNKNTNLSTPKLRGYIFEGWFDNENYLGNPITNLSQTTSNKLFAKWSIDQEQVDHDNANLVDIYIYNLTTKLANRNETTVGYVKKMYDSLSNNAKLFVKNYDTLEKYLKDFNLKE